MSNLRTVEIKAFVPARDFALSKRFYQDLGFTMASDSDGIAGKYGVKVTPDPSGVLWRIAQNTD